STDIVKAVRCNDETPPMEITKLVLALNALPGGSAGFPLALPHAHLARRPPWLPEGGTRWCPSSLPIRRWSAPTSSPRRMTLNLRRVLRVRWLERVPGHGPPPECLGPPPSECAPRRP